MVKINLDADILKVLRRIPVKIIVLKSRSVGWSSLITESNHNQLPSAMQGMKL